ncbi:hypothetical protein OQA88_237 [Cercophora sp. LCS_1]
MKDFNLPSIGNMAFLSPPTSPGAGQTQFHPSSNTTSTTLERSPESICAEALGQLAVSSRACVWDDREAIPDAASLRIGLQVPSHVQPVQQLPPISHIMKDIPLPALQHQGGWQMARHSPVFFGGIPTPSLSPISPSSPGFPFPAPGIESRIGRSYSVPTIPTNISELVEVRDRQSSRSRSVPGRRACLFTNADHSHRPRNESRRYEPYGVFERPPSRPSGAIPPPTRQRDHMSSRPVMDSMYASDSDSDVEPYSQPGRSFVGKAPRGHPGGGSGKGSRKKRGKGSNKEYTWEEKCFIIYHKVDLKLDWKAIKKRFNMWFPWTRDDTGLNCKYYRTNARIPVLTEDGQLVLGPIPGADLKQKEWVLEAKMRRDLEEKYVKTGDREIGTLLSKPTWSTYDGVMYKARVVQVREGEVSLVERFPDHCFYPWVLPKHQEKAREAAARREAQKQAWLRVHNPTSDYCE